MNVQQTQISAADIVSRRDAGSGWHAQIPDDKAMLRAARDLTKSTDLGRHSDLEALEEKAGGEAQDPEGEARDGGTQTWKL